MKYFSLTQNYTSYTVVGGLGGKTASNGSTRTITFCEVITNYFQHTGRENQNNRTKHIYGTFSRGVQCEMRSFENDEEKKVLDATYRSCDPWSCASFLLEAAAPPRMTTRVTPCLLAHSTTCFAKSSVWPITTGDRCCRNAIFFFSTVKRSRLVATRLSWPSKACLRPKSRL